MYEESNFEGNCKVHVKCDHPGCEAGMTVILPTHDQCQWELYRWGWRLHKKQQLCPKHAEQVARRLRNR